MFFQRVGCNHNVVTIGICFVVWVDENVHMLLDIGDFVSNLYTCSSRAVLGSLFTLEGQALKDPASDIF